MYRHKRFLAIIPARSGSKGLPDKNIKLLNHKPLMAHTIEAAVQSGMFDDIIVSTDSLAYAKLAGEYGAFIPFLRPEILASDTATTSDVVLHILEQLKQMGRVYDYFMLLQPTSPLRNKKHILESTDLLFKHQADAIVSICELEHPSFLSVYLKHNGSLDFIFRDNHLTRRQEAVKEYRINGAIYLCGTDYFIKHESFYGKKTYPYMMDFIYSIDIDHEYQFKMAEWVMNELS